MRHEGLLIGLLELSSGLDNIITITESFPHLRRTFSLHPFRSVSSSSRTLLEMVYLLVQVSHDSSPLSSRFGVPTLPLTEHDQCFSVGDPGLTFLILPFFVPYFHLPTLVLKLRDLLDPSSSVCFPLVGYENTFSNVSVRPETF